MKKLIVLISLLVAPLLAQAQSVSTLAVEPMGQDQYLSYNFGSQFVNSRSFVDFSLTAKGPEATVIKRVTISGMYYDASTNCPEVLEVGKSCTARVYFWPAFEGSYWGDLNLYLNDGNIYIRLFGSAIR